MSTHIDPIGEVNQKATAALVRELGVVNTIRFLNQFRVGHGDYTIERTQLFRDQSLEQLVQDIELTTKHDT
jgi:hypothetical protein